MTRFPLREIARTDDLLSLETTLAPGTTAQVLGYRTPTGALARLDGVVIGAFDREHDEIEIAPCEHERTLELEVERFALPTNGLPAGDGLAWRLMLMRAHAKPSFEASLRPCFEAPLRGAPQRDNATHGNVVLWGHSHLDVAWLWNYTESKRKAMRTFANALALVEADDRFVYIQSQPQLYAFVEEADAAFFERVRDAVRGGRFSAEPAAMWVEPDCNTIDGESVLRQMLLAHDYCTSRFGVEPLLCWLPDTFGFASTLPTLLAHAGIGRFASTKLQWNETTRFPYEQFVWRGPDGSEVVSAMLANYEGSATPERVARAVARREPLIIGYSDGGGGPTLEQVRAAEGVGEWEKPSRWFERLEGHRATLPVHEGDLYLEYHRGTYTTHHDIKAQNAAFERELNDIEERLAWCIAVRAPDDIVGRLRPLVNATWQIVLRNQFHDVLPGTSVRSAYEEAHADYVQAEEALQLVRTSTAAMLPRAARYEEQHHPVKPRVEDEDYVFDNGLIHARLSSTGALLELSAKGVPNVVAQGNLLAAYRDRPKKWDAWNLDAGYEKKRVRVKPTGHELCEDGLELRFEVARSPIAMRIHLRKNEPFLRVDCAVDWRAQHTILRMENWLTVQTESVTFGAPHGTITRSTRRETPAERARFEVPGQRFATLHGERAGLAIFTLDTYGWSARSLTGGGVQLGHSLLRSPTWPDPQADAGMQELRWAFAPHPGASLGRIELAWEQFAKDPRVRLFSSSDPGVLVTAVKPAQNGDGVIVRARECDGEVRTLRLRCGARMRSVERVDALERPLGKDASIDGEELVATIQASAIASFRVRF